MAARAGTNFTTDDLDYIGRPRETRYDSWGTAEILNEHRGEISTGRSMDGIGELGHLHRQLLQESDFHAVGRVLLHKLSPEEESERFGFDGTPLSEDLKAILLTLDEIGLDSRTLKATVKLAIDEPETLDWIADNWETFLDTKPDDALANANFGLQEVSDTGDFSVRKEDDVESDFGPGRDSYQTVEYFRKSLFKEAAYHRLVSLKEQLQSIQDCHTPEALDKRLWTIRQAYGEDHKVIQDWGPTGKEIDRKAYLTTLHKQRTKLERLRQDGLTDEILDFEAIRGKVWFCFDREKETKATQETVRPLRKDWVNFMDPATGKITDDGFYTDSECDEQVAQRIPDPRTPITEKTISPPSLWEIDKSRAFCDLNQTRSQWNRIYNYLWERMTETILWELADIKNASDGAKVCWYIKKYRFRLNADKLGEAITEKAKKVQTENGAELIRRLLATCQYQIGKETTKNIVKELCRRRTECALS